MFKLIDSELETTGQPQINMSLPHKNEEYGTEVYWWVVDGSFGDYGHSPNNPSIRDKRYEQYVFVYFHEKSWDTVDD